MRLVITVLFVVASFGLIASAFASMNVLEYQGGPMGKVTFDGKAHNEKLGAGKCMECHKDNVPFAMKKPGDEGSIKIKAPHKPGEFCGVCHDGTKAFAVTECVKCHKKQ